jgi:hypothetical protein
MVPATSAKAIVPNRMSFFIVASSVGYATADHLTYSKAPIGDVMVGTETRFGRAFALDRQFRPRSRRADVGERVPIRVPDDEAGVGLLDRPERREAAGLSHRKML